MKIYLFSFFFSVGVWRGISVANQFTLKQLLCRPYDDEDTFQRMLAFRIKDPIPTVTQAPDGLGFTMVGSLDIEMRYVNLE